MIDTLEAQDLMLLKVLHAACKTSARADKDVQMAVLYLWKKYTMAVIVQCVDQLNEQTQENHPCHT